MDFWIDLPPVALTTAGNARSALQPTRLHQAIEQMLGLLSIQPLAKGFPADLFARHLVFGVRDDPP
jgi:hypothetical protein